MTTYSVVTKIADGSTSQFAISFPGGFMAREDITCRVGSETDGNGDPKYRPLLWVSDGVVNVVGEIPGNGVEVVFERKTDISNAVNAFSNATVLNRDSLDNGFKQVLLGLQELADQSVQDRLDAAVDAANLAASDAAGHANDAQTYQIAASQNQAASTIAKNQAEAAAAAAANDAVEANSALGTTVSVRNAAQDARDDAEAARDAAQAARDVTIAAGNQVISLDSLSLTNPATISINNGAATTSVPSISNVKLFRIGSMVDLSFEAQGITSQLLVAPTTQELGFYFNMNDLLQAAGTSLYTVASNSAGYGHVTNFAMPVVPMRFSVSDAGIAQGFASDMSWFTKTTSSFFFVFRVVMEVS